MASHFSRIRLPGRRLMELARDTYADADAPRLAARLRKHGDSLFTFLDCPDVPFDNHYAERMIARPWCRGRTARAIVARGAPRRKRC